MRRTDRQVTDPNEIEAIIRKAKVCHLALADGDQPYLVTMNFGYKSGTPACIYFHCANEGRKLDIIRANQKVCFQFETDLELVTAPKACGYSYLFKSVVGVGTIWFVESIDEKQNGLELIMQQYASEKNYSDFEPDLLSRTTVLLLKVDEVSAKVKL